MNRSPAEFDAIVRVKRVVYLTALPLVVALGFITRSVEIDLGSLPITNAVALPLVLGIGALFWVLLWFRRDVRPLELAFVVAAGAYLLATLYVSSSEAYHTDGDDLMLLARIGYWLAPYFLLVTMVFGTRGGLIVSSGFLGLALIQGLGHFQNPEGHMPDRAADAGADVREHGAGDPAAGGALVNRAAAGAARAGDGGGGQHRRPHRPQQPPPSRERAR